MTFHPAYEFSSGKTPSVIRWLIGLTCLITLICALLNPLFVNYLGIRGPNDFLTLSWYGILSGYLWQFVSYLFVEEGAQGVSFALLLSLFFQMYLLWMMGSSLAERVGSTSFLLFYLAAGAGAGLVTVLTGWFFGFYPFLTGQTGALTAIWVVWTMMHPDSELLFFFLVRIKAKWLLGGGLAAIFLVNLSQGNVPIIIYYLTSACLGYGWGKIAWGLESIWNWTERLDAILEKWQSKLKHSSSFTPHDKTSKIIDIHTGTPLLNDDEFVDAMLAKISEKGEQSLSWNERRRLRKISEKHSKH